MISRLLVIILTLFILITCVPGSSFFSWHPTFMTLAYGLMFFEGVSAFSSILYKKCDVASKITVHWIIQVTATALSVIGFAVVFYNKIARSKQHFVTWHATFGLAAVIATIAVCGGGVMAKYSVYFKKYTTPLAIKTVHALFACVALLLGCISFILGMNSNYFIRATAQYHEFWRIIMIIPAVLVSLVFVQVARSYLPRYKVIKNGN